MTPNLHRIHHSARQPETDSNSGAVFRAWDIAFGTFRPTPRVDHEIMRLVLDEVRGERAERLISLVASPLYAKMEAAPGHAAIGEGQVDEPQPMREAHGR